MATGIPSLAARCTTCQTVFRVVPDQLRVSGGWVRCGRCTAVFNAADNLVELEDGVVRRSVRLPTPVSPGAEPDIDITASAPSTAAPAHFHPPSSDVVATSDGAVVGDWIESPPYSDGAAVVDDPQPAPATPDVELPGEEPAEVVDRELRSAYSAAEAADTATVEAAGVPIEARMAQPEPIEPVQPEIWVDPPTSAAPPITAPLRAPASTRAAAAADDTPVAPSFVRRADRAERWRQPRVRATLAAAAALLTAALVLQVLVEYRDLAAARYPALRPVLQAACAVTGCKVDAARAIDGLTVESSGLVRIERSDRYRLAVTLRNRAGIDLALPALELSLTDTQGRLLARRVLPLAELGATQATVPAGRELSVQATLRAAPGAAGEAVAGYTIELFYP